MVTFDRQGQKSTNAKRNETMADEEPIEDAAAAAPGAAAAAEGEGQVRAPGQLDSDDRGPFREAAI